MNNYTSKTSQSISLDFITSQYMDLLDMSEANISRDAILKKIKPLESRQKNDIGKFTESPLFNGER